MLATTKEFIGIMESNRFGYEIRYEDKDGGDCIRIQSKGEKSGKTFDVLVFFSANPDKASLRIRQVCTVPSEKVGTAMIEVNNLNHDLFFTKFYLGDNDGSLEVTAESDYYLGVRYCLSEKTGSYIGGGALCAILCGNLVEAADGAYVKLMRAMWNN